MSDYIASPPLIDWGRPSTQPKPPRRRLLVGTLVAAVVALAGTTGALAYSLHSERNHARAELADVRRTAVNSDDAVKAQLRRDHDVIMDLSNCVGGMSKAFTSALNGDVYQADMDFQGVNTTCHSGLDGAAKVITAIDSEN